ncbi:MAG: hypothetical protein DHS20C08_25020 [Rhodomicrobium sp.]|nr:MAG: hypothetical protein DHS20C08_25020 [Rhodomicrobium sp.]
MHTRLSSIWLAIFITGLTITALPSTLAAEVPEEQTPCKKPIKISGPANQIQSMAELQTIIIWTEKVADKFSTNYAHWHNAKNKRIKCKRSSGSRYFYCELSASPCISTEITAEPEQTEEAVGAAKEKTTIKAPVGSSKSQNQ